MRMEMSREHSKAQNDYLIAMSLMKEMKSKGIIDKEDLLKAEVEIAARFDPAWRYQEYEL